jgi:transposase, IS30 family
MKPYKRLTIFEREEISRFLSTSSSFHKIAKILNRSASTILREIRRQPNLYAMDYRAVHAQLRFQRRKRQILRPRKLDTHLPLQKFVLDSLALRWSPVQIAKRLIIQYPNDQTMRISHESIYTYIYIHPREHLRRQLLYHLRRKHKYRRWNGAEKHEHGPIKNYVSIDQRPLEAADRKIPGHWEGDLIIGAKNTSAIGTLVERTTRLTLIVKLDAKNAVTVRESFEKKLNNLPEYLKRSLTYDQGQEMAEHLTFTKNTNIAVYFAHPHSPWERGTNENTNSLIRDFMPKGTDFSKVSAEELQKVQDLLNDRPRKVLEFLTPNEVFLKALR